MSLGTIVLIILVIALLGGFSGLGGGPFYGTGYYGGGGLGLILVIVLILVLLGQALNCQGSAPVGGLQTHECNREARPGVSLSPGRGTRQQTDALCL
jgi:hypothetical protein